MKRRISIFGATGSVGSNTVDLVAAHADQFSVVVVSGGRNIDLLAKQALLLKAKMAVTSEQSLSQQLGEKLAGSGITVAAGRQALLQSAQQTVDWAMCAIVGFAGLEVSLAIAEHGGTLALANKESLVSGGALLKAKCQEHQTTLLPVDSEHSAIFQCLQGQDTKGLERIILTGSGGPFLHKSLEEMALATPQMAMKHPNWDMGDRISIDSASMFNKAMEVIETKELFDVEPNSIEVVIHPQSLVHCIVGFKDGNLLSHLGPADMRCPIGFSLFWPQRAELPMERLDFASLGTLEFLAPDECRFPALRLAREVMETGGFAGPVFNAAKEAALDLFLDRKIGFLDMASFVESALENISISGNFSLDAVIDADKQARRFVFKRDAV